MDSCGPHSLRSLLVFKNTLNQELIRSLHMYGLENGNENEVEREFLFSNNGAYVELRAYPVLKLMKLCVSQVIEGYMNGCWVCILAFHAKRSPNFTCIPCILSVSRNPRLKLIPNLAMDLQMVGKMACVKVEKEPLQNMDEETSQGNRGNHHQLRSLSLLEPLKKSGEETSQGSNVTHHQVRRSLPTLEPLKKSDEEASQGNDGDHRRIRSLPMLDLDLNRPPCSMTVSELSDDQESGRQSPGNIEKKNIRAASDRVSKLTLQDLVKYFDIPIVEASNRLNVGLTVLKKKCREFGIPRWPHRKIKSIDSLIRDLQEETVFQQKDNKDAALAVANRRRMLECERESIERKPFLDMKLETKRLRQDIFKKRHRARVLRTLEAKAYHSPGN